MSDQILLSSINPIRRSSTAAAPIRLDSSDLTTSFAEIFELSKIPIQQPSSNPSDTPSPDANQRIEEPDDSSPSEANSTSSDPQHDSPTANAADVSQRAQAADTSDSEIDDSKLTKADVATDASPAQADSDGDSDSDAHADADSTPPTLVESQTGSESIDQHESGSDNSIESLDSESIVLETDTLDARVETAALDAQDALTIHDQEVLVADVVAPIQFEQAPIQVDEDLSVDNPLDLEKLEPLIPSIDVERQEPRTRKGRGKGNREAAAEHGKQTDAALLDQARRVNERPHEPTVPQPLASDAIRTTAEIESVGQTVVPQQVDSVVKPLQSAAMPVAANVAAKAASNPPTSASPSVDAAASVGATNADQTAKPTIARPQASETSRLDLADRARLLQRVARAFQQLGADGGSLKIRLHPPRLGSVSIDVSVSGKKLNARIVTESDTASNVLRESLPELRSRLAEQGFQIESVEITTDAESQSRQGNQQDPSQSFRDVVGQPKNDPRGELPGEETTHDPRTIASSTSGLDLVA